MIEETIERSRLRAVELRKKITPSQFSTLVETLEVRFRNTRPMENTATLRLRNRLYEGPIIGYLAKLIVSIVRLPVRLKQIYAELEHLDRLGSHLKHESQKLQETVQALALTYEKFQNAVQSVDALQSLNHNVIVQNEAFRSEIREKITRCLEAMPVLENKISQLRYGSEPAGGVNVAAPSDDISPAFYAAFERRFRSSPTDLARHFDNYRSILQSVRNPAIEQVAIDLGCGRGEWLRVLKEHGFKAIGVDTNSTTNDSGRNSDLQIIESDSLAYLKGCASNSLDMITSFHFIEHVGAGYMLQLVQQAFRTLKPGGLIIMETPNPENLIVSTCNFYMDPTHKRPIPPAALAFATDFFGFEVINCMRFNPLEPKYEGEDAFIQRVSSHFCAGQDYAIVSRKPQIT